MKTVADLRFLQADSENVAWVLAAFAVGLLAIAIPSLLQLGVVRRLRRGDRPASRDRLRELALAEGEDLVLRNVVHYSGDSAERCLQSVEVFDRGVDELLSQAARLPSIQRVDLLRTVRSLRRKLGFDRTRPDQILHSTRTLPVGQSITLSRAGAPDTEEILEATILQVDDEGMTLRLGPGHTGSGRRLLDEEPAELEVRFFRPDDSAYAFRSPVIELRDHGPGVVRIAHPKRLHRQQRRSFLRVDVNEPIQFRWFPALLSGKQLGLRGELDHLMGIHGGTVTNLSGGGMQLRVADLEIQDDDWVETHFPFLPPPLDREPCLARVVQIYNRPPDGLFGLQFEKPSIRLESGILREVERRHRAFRARAAMELPV